MSRNHDSGYSPRFIAFVLVPCHTEAFQAAYLDQSQSSSNELIRLAREYATLPPRHSCSCRCPNESRGYPACHACQQLRAAAVAHDIPREQGRTSPIEPPMPSTLLLDLHRAISVLGTASTPSAIARYLSGPPA